MRGGQKVLGNFIRETQRNKQKKNEKSASLRRGVLLEIKGLEGERERRKTRSLPHSLSAGSIRTTLALIFDLHGAIEASRLT